MGIDYLQSISTDVSFIRLVNIRRIITSILSVIMLVLYVGFILLMSLGADWLGQPIIIGGHITRGIYMGVGLIIISFLLTGIYIFLANRIFDKLANDFMIGIMK